MKQPHYTEATEGGMGVLKPSSFEHVQTQQLGRWCSTVKVAQRVCGITGLRTLVCWHISCLPCAF